MTLDLIATGASFMLGKESRLYRYYVPKEFATRGARLKIIGLEKISQEQYRHLRYELDWVLDYYAIGYRLGKAYSRMNSEYLRQQDEVVLQKYSDIFITLRRVFCKLVADTIVSHLICSHAPFDTAQMLLFTKHTPVQFRELLIDTKETDCCITIPIFLDYGTSEKPIDYLPFSERFFDIEVEKDAVLERFNNLQLLLQVDQCFLSKSAYEKNYHNGRLQKFWCCAQSAANFSAAFDGEVYFFQEPQKMAISYVVRSIRNTVHVQKVRDQVYKFSLPKEDDVIWMCESLDVEGVDIVFFYRKNCSIMYTKNGDFYFNC